MASTALIEWRAGTTARLATLKGMASRPGISPDELRQAEFALVTQLSSEFQHYCSELHRLVVAELMKQTATQTKALEVQIENALSSVSLAKGNADRRNINQDFRRLGLVQLTARAEQEDARATAWLTSLDKMLEFRNPIAHGNYQRIPSLLSQFPGRSLFDLAVGWEADLGQVVELLDRLTSIWLASFLGLGRPW